MPSAITTSHNISTMRLRPSWSSSRQNVGEAEQVDGFTLLPGSFSHQLANLVIAKLEALPQQGFECPALGRIELSVDHRCMHKQSRGGQTQLVLVKISCRLLVAGDAIGEILEPGPDRH